MKSNTILNPITLLNMIILLDKLVNEGIDIYYIDLFCGAGGTSTGVELATVNGRKVAKVIICINHDKNAIASHFANHPDALHFTEDIRTLDLSIIVSLVKKIRIRQPNAKFVLWASLECTNFSKAKGGLPRDADSRTLAEHLFRYIHAIDPDYIQIENVEEFMSWGDLDENGKPISKNKGLKYLQWIDRVQYNYGLHSKRILKENYDEWFNLMRKEGSIKKKYNFESRILNSADFGAYTSRKRFFAQFAKCGLPISWPEQTHSKELKNDLFSNLEKWKPVKECLDFADEGESIFNRKKDLSEKTLERIYAGLIKFVAGGKDKWLLKYNSVNGVTGKHNPPGIDEPCPTIATQNRLGIIQTTFLSKYFSGHPESKNQSIESPSGAITTKDHHSIVTTNFVSKYYSGKPDQKNYGIDEPAHTIRTKDGQALISAKNFLSAYYGKGHNTSVESPSSTITTKDRLSLIQPRFMDQQYGCSKPVSIFQPLGALTAKPKFSLISCENWLMNTNYNNVGSSLDDPSPVITANRKYHYLMDAQYSRVGRDINEPCFTLIARMDKTPPYFISIDSGDTICIYDPYSWTYETVKEKPVFIYADIDFQCPILYKIYAFMALYGIVDIKMRMLRIPELKRIMGFPESYVLIGTQAEQKKYIGNAVEVKTAKALCEANARELLRLGILKIAA